MTSELINIFWSYRKLFSPMISKLIVFVCKLDKMRQKGPPIPISRHRGIVLTSPICPPRISGMRPVLASWWRPMLGTWVTSLRPPGNVSSSTCVSSDTTARSGARSVRSWWSWRAEWSSDGSQMMRARSGICKIHWGKNRGGGKGLS